MRMRCERDVTCEGWRWRRLAERRAPLGAHERNSAMPGSCRLLHRRDPIYDLWGCIYLFVVNFTLMVSYERWPIFHSSIFFWPVVFPPTIILCHRTSLPLVGFFLARRPSLVIVCTRKWALTRPNFEESRATDAAAKAGPLPWPCSTKRPRGGGGRRWRRGAEAVFSYHPKKKNSSSHRIFRHIYGVLNVDKKIIIQFGWKP
jgi:hypothetical protein